MTWGPKSPHLQIVAFRRLVVSVLTFLLLGGFDPSTDALQVLKTCTAIRSMHLPRHRYSEKKDGTYRSLHSRITNLWDKAQGWQFGVLFCACSTSLVFILNLAVTAWSLSHYRLSDGQQVLFEGSCDKANNVNTALHFVINVFSTILLSSSNYCMQCLSAPTREEVDKAHAKRRWLDIGVLSTKNLFSISRKRAVAWCLLGASSVPLHLL